MPVLSPAYVACRKLFRPVLAPPLQSSWRRLAAPKVGTHPPTHLGGVSSGLKIRARLHGAYEHPPRESVPPVISITRGVGTAGASQHHDIGEDHCPDYVVKGQRVLAVLGPPDRVELLGELGSEGAGPGRSTLPLPLLRVFERCPVEGSMRLRRSAYSPLCMTNPGARARLLAPMKSGPREDQILEGGRCDHQVACKVFLTLSLGFANGHLQNPW